MIADFAQIATAIVVFIVLVLIVALNVWLER